MLQIITTESCIEFNETGRASVLFFTERPECDLGDEFIFFSCPSNRFTKNVPYGQVILNGDPVSKSTAKDLFASAGFSVQAKIRVLDEAKTETPAIDATGSLTHGQLFRGILSTILLRLSVLVGGRSLVENLGCPTTARQLTLVASTVNDVQLTANIRRISVYSTVDAFYLIGTSAQTPSVTTGHIIAGGERQDILLNNSSTPHIAFISASAGTVYITELTTPAS